MATVFNNYLYSTLDNVNCANFVHYGFFPLFCRKSIITKFALRKNKEITLHILLIDEVYFCK